MPESAPKPRPIKITQVSYGMTVNVGNYENVKFELTAQVAADEDWRDVLDVLRHRSLKIREQEQSAAKERHRLEG